MIRTVLEGLKDMGVCKIKSYIMVDVNYYKTNTGKFQFMWESPPATANGATSKSWGGRSILRALWVQRTPFRSLGTCALPTLTQTRI